VGALAHPGAGRCAGCQGSRSTSLASGSRLLGPGLCGDSQAVHGMAAVRVSGGLLGTAAVRAVWLISPTPPGKF